MQDRNSQKGSGGGEYMSYKNEMGRKRFLEGVERKEVQITFRLTPSEDDRLHDDMERGNYISMTKYIKSRLFRGNGYAASAPLLDRRFLDKVNRITDAVEGLGNSYTEAVAFLKGICDGRRHAGDRQGLYLELIDEIDHLAGLTLEVRNEVARLIALIESEIEEDKGQ